MGSEKTKRVLGKLDWINIAVADTPPAEEVIIEVVKSPIDKNRFTKDDPNTYAESRGARWPAVTTNKPYDYFVEKMRFGNKVYFLASVDTQFAEFEQVKQLIDLTNQFPNIYLFIEGLNLNFRGQHYALSDFKGTMYDVLKMIPRDKVKFQQEAMCNYCGEDGATHTVRWVQYGDKPRQVVPYYDKLTRVGSHLKEGVSKEDPLAIGHDEKEEITFYYGACHLDELIQEGKAEWDAIHSIFELLGRNERPFNIGEVQTMLTKSHRAISSEVFKQIVNRFLEERIIALEGENAYWIKAYRN